MQASLHSMTMVIECKNIGAQVSKQTDANDGHLLRISQCSTTYHESFPQLPIQAAQNFIQTTLFRWRPLDPDEKPKWLELKDYLFLLLAQANPLFSFTKK
jgi:hypothetical protein